MVALDDDDGTIEVQYVDGTLEELDREDWKCWCDERTLEAADPSEDWSDSADVEADEGHTRFDRYVDGSDLGPGHLTASISSTAAEAKPVRAAHAGAPAVSADR